MYASRRAKQILLLIGDTLILIFALFLALCVRDGGIPSGTSWLLHLRFWWLNIALTVLLFYFCGFYAPEYRIGGWPIVVRLLASTVVATLILALVFYLSRAASIAPKTLLLIYGSFAFLSVWCWRSIIQVAWMSRNSLTGVAFVGCNSATEELSQFFFTHPGSGYETRLVFTPNDSRYNLPPSVCVTRDFGEFIKKTEELTVGMVVVGETHASLDKDMAATLLGLLGKPIYFTNIPSLYELVFKRVPLGLIDDHWFLENIDLRSKRYYEPAKRFSDIVLSLVGMAITSPFWPLVALAVKLSSPGPVFFKQRRLGRSGKTFTIIKFRTMRTDKNDFAPTSKKDPRVTAIGLFLRKTRLDEIPQLLNILVGDMSFVGPRPERPELASGLEKAIPFYNQRLLVKPGLTGWDQVSGEYHSPSIEDTYKKLQYDLFYVKNQSPALDVSILFWTVKTVLKKAGQ